MSLFQNSVVQKYLSNLNTEKLKSSFEQFKKFYGDQERINNIRQLKEENYQEGFLREIFCDVLGYTINPNKNYNLTTEYKNETDSKKADGAILLEGKAIGVIELKSTKTINLESITDQAFNYKNHQSSCRYIITSNFEKLRFYIDNATDYEEFDLFNLDFTSFTKLYLFISKESIFGGVPSKLKEESKIHEETISDKLYKDYREIKNKIFNNLITNNPQFDKILLFQKSQKLLDRILFILFAEDSGLVPPNAITKIVDQWKHFKELDEPVSLYSRFIKFFHHMDVGHKYKDYEIPPYNGGLFQTDEVLDKAIIDDEVLETGTLKLSTYDFSSEVDVNILGHIFEHSLSEIEEVAAKLEGKETDKSKSRRKKEGVYYTPKYITKYIVDNTVGALAKEKKERLGLLNIDEKIFQDPREKKKKKYNELKPEAKELFDNFQKYRDYLLTLKILDPACGSGAFLNQALDFLIKEHTWIAEQTSSLLGEALVLSDVGKDILEKNLYGVDINEEAVEIAKLSLWLRTAQKGRKLSDLSSHIKCGNSLIDDPAVAGSKAFDWNKEFPEVFPSGHSDPSAFGGLSGEESPNQKLEGFDVVIGNPPYVRAEMILPYKLFLEKNYESFNGNADLYIFFYEKGLSLLKTNGLLSFISPNKWIQSNYGSSLRTFLTNFYIKKIIDFGELAIFKDVGTFPSIVIIQKCTSKEDLFYTEITSYEQTQKITSSQLSFTRINQKNLEQENWIFKNTEIVELIKKLENSFDQLGNIFAYQFLAGVKTGLNDLFIFSKEQINSIIGENIEEFSLFKPIVFGKDIEKYIINIVHPKFLFFPYKYENCKAVLLDLEQYPKTYNYYKKFEKELSNRAIIKEGITKKTHKWYELQQINRFIDYSKPKIIYPDIAIENRFYLDIDGHIPDMTCFMIPLAENTLLGILNSTMFKFLASNYCPILGNYNDGGRIRYKSTYLAKIPFPKIASIISSPIRSVVDLAKLKRIECLNQEKRFLNLLQNNFTIDKLTTKLLEFYNHDFATFLTELKKQKVNLTLKQQEEWEPYFTETKTKINKLQTQIAQTDKEIDQMVYQLYGLTEEEINIVESS